MNVWEEGGRWHAATSEGVEAAARAIRTNMIQAKQIGRFSTVTVELLSASTEINVYREVR